MNTASDNATSASSKSHIIAILHRAFAAALIATITGCATPPAPTPTASAVPPVSASATPAQPAKAVFRPSTFSEIPGWADDTQAASWPAFVAGCQRLLAQPPSIWRSVCTDVPPINPADNASVRLFFETHFNPYQITTTDGRDSGVVTGYYEPLLKGSRQRSDRFSVPLYGVPDDLLSIEIADLYPDLKDKRVRGRIDGRRVVPYWTRADVESGRARLSGKELAWVDDSIDAFFLQIQGSGRVQLEEGGVMRVGYADQNGHPFRSIGRLLVERGELPLERASMQGIKQWARDHPDKLNALLDENPSYVFFREVIPDPAWIVDGPIGSLGVPLLATRTVAIDPTIVPLSAPLFLATTYPLSDRPLQRLVFAQDTGGAIKGPLRADFFWGFGEDAARDAGRMKQNGRMWILWPKDAPPPS